MEDNTPVTSSLLKRRTLNSTRSHYGMATNTIVDYVNFINREFVRESVYKVELINKSDETPYASIEDTIINGDGSLSVSYNTGGVRRTCSFSLVNKNNEYTKMFANLSIGSKFKLSLGYLINDEPYYFQQGIFVFDNPTMVSDPQSKLINVTGSDKWSMLNGTNGGITTATYQVTRGAKLKNVIETTLALDIVYDPIRPNVDESIADFEMPYDIVKDAGANIADILTEVVGCANAYIYYDVNGVCTVRPYEYDEAKGSVHHFRLEDKNFLSANRTFNYDILFNATYTIADNLQNDAVPIYAESLNTDPSDPNSVPNLGYKKYKPITENIKGITTQSLAQQRVDYELNIWGALQSTLSITCLSLYHVLENDVILVTDPNLNAFTERFVISSYTIPISTEGNMSVTARKAMGYIL